MTLLSRRSPAVATGYATALPSRVGVVGTVAVHALLIGGYFLIPADMVKTIVPTILIGANVPVTPPPPEQPPEQPVEHAQAPLQKPVERSPFIPDRAVDLDTGTLVTGADFPTDVEAIDIGTIKPAVIDPPRPDILVPVSMNPRFMRDFQPDYPPSMQRAQEEGKVTVRLLIDAEGRVTSVEKLSATTEAFWEATRQQALRKWRFRPATRNGVPIASEKVMTVHFQLS